MSVVDRGVLEVCVLKFKILNEKLNIFIEIYIGIFYDKMLVILFFMYMLNIFINVLFLIKLCDFFVI